MVFGVMIKSFAFVFNINGFVFLLLINGLINMCDDDV